VAGGALEFVLFDVKMANRTTPVVVVSKTW
jgi:hypothetical protein